MGLDRHAVLVPVQRGIAARSGRDRLLACRGATLQNDLRIGSNARTGKPRCLEWARGGLNSGGSADPVSQPAR